MHQGSLVSGDRFDRQACGPPFRITVLEPADAIATGPESCDGLEGKDAIGATAVRYHLLAFRKLADASFQFG